MDKTKFWRQIKIHEGVRGKVYYDTTGHRTVGIGFNLERKDARDLIQRVGANYDSVLSGEYELDKEQMRLLFEEELKDIEFQAREAIKNYDQLSDVRQRVVCDMIFNLGFWGFLKFKNTRKHIENEDWSRVGEHMLASKWARQVKGRAKNLAAMMVTGEDVYDL